MKTISQRVSQPSPDLIKEVRQNAKLTQADAAAIILGEDDGSYRRWVGYETPIADVSHVPIPLAMWELFLLITSQHRHFIIARREMVQPTGSGKATSQTRENWFTVFEIAKLGSLGIGELPSNSAYVNTRAKMDNWKSRPGRQRVTEFQLPEEIYSLVLDHLKVAPDSLKNV